MTLVEVALIQASFPNVGSKQKNKNEHTVYHDIFIQKPGLLKTWKYRFSLVWVMEFSIISPSFNRSKTFSDNSNLQAQLTFNVSMKTVNESYMFLMEFILCLKCFICSRVGILDSPRCNKSCCTYKELGEGNFCYSIRKKLSFPSLQFIYKLPLSPPPTHPPTLSDGLLASSMKTWFSLKI